MKKVLLLSACVAAALTMSAQKANKVVLPMPSKAELCKKADVKVMKRVNDIDFRSNADMKQSTASVATKAIATGDLYGYYVADGFFSDNTTALGSSVVATSTELEFTDGTTQEGITFDGLFASFVDDAQGVVEDDNIFIFPGEFMGEVELNNGTTAVVACFAVKPPSDPKNAFDVEVDEEENFVWPRFSVNEDENGRYLSYENEGYMLGAWQEDPSAEGGYKYLGYLLYVFDAYTVNYCNFAAQYRESHIGNGDWTEWAPVTDYLFVEDGGDYWTIHGFNGMFVFDLNIDEEAGEAFIPRQQIIPAGELVDGVPFYIAGQHPESLWLPVVNEDYETPLLYNAETRTAKHAFVDGEGELKNLSLALAGQMEPSADGSTMSAYWYEIINGAEFGPLESFGLANGINTVVRPNQSARTTYNLAGQRVDNPSLKGTYIENGRKVIR